MSDYTLELNDSTANVRCSCCAAGLTSICGFVRKQGRPFGMYYALLHDNRERDFVRLSVSLGEGWSKRDFAARRALCVDITLRHQDCVLSVQDADASPQQGFAAFGQWLNREDVRGQPIMQEFLEILKFLMEQDRAIRSYLAGEKIDFGGRHPGNGHRN